MHVNERSFSSAGRSHGNTGTHADAPGQGVAHERLKAMVRASLRSVYANPIG